MRTNTINKFSLVRAILFISVLMLAMTSCTGMGYPTVPYGGEYNGGYGDGGGYYKPPNDDYDDYYDNKPQYADEVEGVWDGFLWERYRSDNQMPGKKMLAIRFTFADITWDYSGRHEWVKVNILVDGRPAVTKKTEVKRGGYIDLASYQSDVDLWMDGRFHNDRGEGDMTIEWDEKVKNPWTGKVEMCWVRLGGDFGVNRDYSGRWGAAWELFDTYGDEAFGLSEDIWEAATAEGRAYLESIELSTMETCTLQ